MSKFHKLQFDNELYQDDIVFPLYDMRDSPKSNVEVFFLFKPSEIETDARLSCDT